MTLAGRLFVIAVLNLVTIVPRCEAQAPTPADSPQRSDDSASSETNQPNSTTNKPVVVTIITVTGQPLAVSLAPASVSVVDDEEIKHAHALTSSDIMRTVPFINLEQNGSAGSLSALTIRGGKPNLILMLIDGIPVNASGSGDPAHRRAQPGSALRRRDLARAPSRDAPGSLRYMKNNARRFVETSSSRKCGLKE